MSSIWRLVDITADHSSDQRVQLMRPIVVIERSPRLRYGREPSLESVRQVSFRGLPCELARSVDIVRWMHRYAQRVASYDAIVAYNWIRHDAYLSARELELVWR